MKSDGLMSWLACLSSLAAASVNFFFLETTVAT